MLGGSPHPRHGFGAIGREIGAKCFRGGACLMKLGGFEVVFCVSIVWCVGGFFTHGFEEALTEAHSIDLQKG